MLSTGVSLPVTSKTMSTAHQTPSPPSVNSLPTPVGMWPSANLCNILFISFIISPPSVSSLPTPVGMWPSANLFDNKYIIIKYK